MIHASSRQVGQVFRKILPYTITAVALFSLFAAYYSMGDRTRLIDKTSMLMGSEVEIKIPVAGDGDRARIESAIGEAFKEIKALEDLLSVFKTDSVTSRIDRLKAGEKLNLDVEIFTLIKKSVEYSDKTRGAFDITIKPLADLWNASGEEKKLPAENDIRDALEKVGARKILLDEADMTISLEKEGMGIDLGGIGQGYATDKATQILKGRGIKSAIVNSSGDIYCLGTRSGKKLWKIGIQHPRRRDEIIFEIFLKDKAISTSGDYEKYFVLNGKRYSHIIDARTGYPVGDDVVSASAVAVDSTTADAFATALCILGESGLDVAESFNIDAIIIVKDRAGLLGVKMTKGFKAKYGLIEKAKL